MRTDCDYWLCDYRLHDGKAVSGKLRPMSNDSCEMTYKTVGDAAHHFGVADKGLSMLHLKLDLQLEA